jgi:hypothetical protein
MLEITRRLPWPRPSDRGPARFYLWLASFATAGLLVLFLPPRGLFVSALFAGLGTFGLTAWPESEGIASPPGRVFYFLFAFAALLVVAFSSWLLITANELREPHVVFPIWERLCLTAVLLFFGAVELRRFLSLRPGSAA